MTVPYNFFSKSAGCPVSLAFGDAQLAAHIPVRKTNAANVGSTFFEIAQSYSHLVLKIFEKQGKGLYTFVGTGSLVSCELVVSVAHLFKPGKIYIIQTIAHEFLHINFSQAQINHKLDYALLPLKKPSTKIKKPPLDFEESTCGAYGMMYYKDKQLVISVGLSSSHSYVEYNPLLALPGIEGASGALVWNDKKKAVALHRGYNKDHPSLRMPLSFHTIISDSRARYGFSLLDYGPALSAKLKAATPFASSNLFPHPDIVPERHGTLKVKEKGEAESLPTRDREKITKDEFESAFNFLDLLRKDLSEKLKFYAGLKGGIGTFLRFKDGAHYPRKDKKEDGRIDQQSPPPHYQNVAVQIRDDTIATLIIHDSLLQYEDNQKQREVANYCLYHLRVAIKYAQKNGQSIQLQIDPR